MGEMRDSDWSRENLLRSDWLPIIVAPITTLGLALFADLASSFCVHAAVDWFCAILINSFHKNSERKVSLNRFFFLSGRSCILWHKNCKNLRKGDYSCPRK